MSKVKLIWRYILIPFKAVQYALWQNDYLYPPKGVKNGEYAWYPYDRKHLWKTRLGFKTGFELAKIILLPLKPNNFFNSALDTLEEGK